MPELVVETHKTEVVIEKRLQEIVVDNPAAPLEVLEVAKQGPPGRDGLLTDYEQTFTDCEECIVNHNLGRYPILGIYSPGGAEMDAQVLNVTVNQLILYFSSPTSGRVRCV